MGNEREKVLAKKSLGQNFLQDANISRKIAGALHIEHGETVVEIGPGHGALTAFLHTSAAGRLVLLEKDNVLAFERMRDGRKLSAQRDFGVVLTDALTMPWQKFTAPWKCIGNLPYNVASPLMWDILSQSPGLLRAVFMIQKEVGQRIVAKPGTSAYGALSVWLQSFVQPKIEFIVPPQVFYPRPKVDSAVLSFVPHAKGTYSFSPEALSFALKKCFQMRRKQLGTIVKSSGYSLEIIEKSHIDPTVRPENLSIEQFHLLSQNWFFYRTH